MSLTQAFLPGVAKCVSSIRPHTQRWRKAVKKQCDILRAKIADRRRYHRRWRYLTRMGRHIVRLRRRLRALHKQYRQTRSRSVLTRIRRLRAHINRLLRKHRRVQHTHRGHALRLLKEMIRVRTARRRAQQQR